MPIYEYKCKKCGNIFETIQKFSDSPLTNCEECETKGSLEKLMSINSFHLKGSGWYLTDYARKNGQSTTNTSTKGNKNKSQESKKSPEKAPPKP